MTDINPRWFERFESHRTQPEDARNASDVDYARVIHSASFRRLQGKTQILNLGDSDFYRTRLTHSLEVSQIAMGIVRQLEQDIAPDLKYILPSQTQIQAVGLTHDLGHPPFGHGGEVALNYCMKDNGGFEGNGQTLRILTRLEKFSQNAGANLTRRTLLGVLKYPAPYSAFSDSALLPCLSDKTHTIQIIDREKSKPPKCYLDSEKHIVDWIFDGLSQEDVTAFTKIKSGKSGKHGKTIHKSLDCSIMDVADDIAYGVHDFEDAIALSMIDEDDFRQFVKAEDCRPFLDLLNEKYPDEFGNDVYGGFIGKLFGQGGARKRQISRLVHHFLTHIEWVDTGEFAEPLLRYRVRLNENVQPFLDALKNLVWEKVIKSANVQQLEFKGQKMVVSVFEAIAFEPESFLPDDTKSKYKESGGDVRVICDYIAGMTDGFLLKTYERLFSPRMGSVFDKL